MFTFKTEVYIVHSVHSCVDKVGKVLERKEPFNIIINLSTTQCTTLYLN